jgi:hypothetical protein
MRRTELAVMLWPFWACAIMAVMGLLITPLNLLVVFFCYVLGLLLLLHAKQSLFRQGVWVSFGPSRLAPRYRQSYWTGYALLAVGVFSNLVALAVMASGAWG